MAVSPAQLRKLALKLPDVTEGTWYGFPAFMVGGKGFSRLWDDGDTLVLKLSFDDRDFLLAQDAKKFFTTDHYRNYPSVLARLSQLTADEATELLDTARAFVAPRKPAKRAKKTAVATKRAPKRKSPKR